MLPQNNPDRIRVVFDDHRLVANAGLLLPATLAQHLGLRELVGHHLDLGCAPGRANTGDKLRETVLHESNQKGSSIMEILNSGPERRLFQAAEEVNAYLTLEKVSWDR